VSQIGLWIVRWPAGPGAPTQVAHLVESEIADRAVTRCGREMRQATKNGELGEADGSVARCEQCVGRIS
jgi:hypothetical protein